MDIGINTGMTLKEYVDGKISDFETTLNRGGDESPAMLSKYDPNSNVTKVSISSIDADMDKDMKIMMNRTLMVNRITDLFGSDMANQYLEDLKSHVIYANDETNLRPYCQSVSLYPFLINGLEAFDGVSDAPKHLSSYSGSFINLVYALAGTVSGAVGLPEALAYFDHFARKDHGDNYIEEKPELITQTLQHIVYGLNQPTGGRAAQAPFTNFAVYDKFFFDEIFGDFVFPDGDLMKWETVDKLQRFFIKFMRKERKKKMLTFPIITNHMLRDSKGKFRDEEMIDFLADEQSKGSSFFFFNDLNASALSSCCLHGSSPVLVKDSDGGIRRMEIRDYKDIPWRDRRNVKVYHDGTWVSAKVIDVPMDGKRFFKVKTANGKELIVTNDHFNPTINGDIKTDNLTTDDYLMFNTSSSSSIHTNDKDLTYYDGLLGLLIGAYLGDGSTHVHESCDSVRTTFSLNSEKLEKLNHIFDGWNINECDHNVIKVETYSKHIHSFIREYVDGDYSHEKRLNLQCIMQSEEFRRGIIEGYYITDGGNSNRIYTTSKGLVSDIETVMTTLGMVSTINVSDRTDEPVVIRGDSFKRNHPLYCIRWYTPGNKRGQKDLFIRKNGQTFFKVVSIEPYISKDLKAYCFEIKNDDEPYFTLPNGIITHNCRLSNEITDNTFSSSLGAGGVRTGSRNVITIIYTIAIQKEVDIPTLIRRVHKYHVAYNSIVDDMDKAGILLNFSGGYVSNEDLFSTIGLTGCLEAGEFLGYDPHSIKYKEWVIEQTAMIRAVNQEGREKYGIKFNSEYVPKMSGYCVA